MIFSCKTTKIPHVQLCKNPMYSYERTTCTVAKEPHVQLWKKNMYSCERNPCTGVKKPYVKLWTNPMYKFQKHPCASCERTPVKVAKIPNYMLQNPRQRLYPISHRQRQPTILMTAYHQTLTYILLSMMDFIYIACIRYNPPTQSAPTHINALQMKEFFLHRWFPTKK